MPPILNFSRSPPLAVSSITALSKIFWPLELPPRRSISPNRARSRAVALSPAPCSGVPTLSTITWASSSMPSFCQTLSLISSAQCLPVARETIQPSTSECTVRYTKPAPCSPSFFRVLRKSYTLVGPW